VKRPWEITFLGGLFIAVGVVAGVAHAWHAPLDRWLVLIELVEEVWAIAGGIFLILGSNWARWALVVWMAFHVWVGALHSVEMGLSHGILAAVITYFLVWTPAAKYFRPTEQ
jgi:hypothetical protein